MLHTATKCHCIRAPRDDISVNLIMKRKSIQFHKTAQYFLYNTTKYVANKSDSSNVMVQNTHL